MTLPHTRRVFLSSAVATTAVAALGPDLLGTTALADPGAGPDPTRAPWARARWIERHVRPPRFPDRWFDVTTYGAVPGGTTDSSDAIRRAIEACHRAGGGHVLVPAGTWLTGPIHLLSNVDLHVAEGAHVLFDTDPSAYLPPVLTRFEGVELYNYSPLVYAYGQHDIAVTGSGILDGQADNEHWWPWKGKTEYGWDPGEPSQEEARDRLIQMAEDGVPVRQRAFGDGDYLRSSFIQPYRCSNVLVEGVTILRSPMWEVHPVLSDHVLVRNVTVDSHGPNNDGCDPECSRMVVIEGCTFDTGDDCIAIKAGRNADGRRVDVPSEDIVVANCVMRDGHGGVTIGSEMTGGVRNVFVHDCTMSSPNLNIALRFKTNSVRGGFISGVHARDVTVGQVAQAVIDIDFYYEEGPGHGFNPDVGGIDVQRMTVESAQRALNLRGYDDDHIHGITLSDVDFGTTAKPSVVENVDDLVLRNVTENGGPLVV